MIDIPASLIERIKTRQTILVAGLGCSRLASLPGWDDLAERMMAWLDEAEGSGAVRAKIRALLASGRRATAVAYLRSKLADDVLSDLISESYPPNPAVPEALALVAKVPWRGVVTTAFDDLWDRALLNDPTNPTRGFLPAEAEALEQHRGRFLLHLCGSAAAADSLCLSPADLRKRITPTGVIEALDDLYQKRSFVFLGFELGDPDLRMVSERVLGANVNHVEHFMLHPTGAGASDAFDADVIRVELGATPVAFSGTLEETMRALSDAWTVVAAEARPPESDVEAWMEIWTRDPGDDESQAVLLRAADRLRAEKDWDKLVDLLLGRVEQLADRGQQVAVLREVGQIFEQELDAPDRAFAALSTAFGLEPESDGLLPELLRVVGKANRWSDFVADYVETANGVADPAARARHGLQIARIYSEELKDLDRAIAEYRQVLAVEPRHGASHGPSHEPALRALSELLARQERWGELLPLLAADAEREASPAREAELRLRIAELQETKLDDDAAAITGYQLVTEIDPLSPSARTALDGLERLYRKKQSWPELSRLLDEKEKRLTDRSEVAKIRNERADLLATIGDVDGSIAILEAVVAGDSANRQALRALEKLYDRQGRDQDYLRTIERLCETATDPEERLTLLRRLGAEWEERPEGLERAAEVTEQILQSDPRDDDAFRAVSRVYRQARRWPALCEAIRRKIEVTDDPAARRDLQAALGKIHDEELREPELALEAYASAEALGDQRESTLEALARLYEQRALWRPATEALDRWAKVAKEPSVRAAAHVRAAALHAEKLGDQGAAEQRYVRALEIDPAEVDALRALAALYRARGDHARVATLVLELAAATEDGVEKARLLFEAATLLEEPLGDEARATELYAAALAADPEQAAAGERLVPIYTRQSRWADLEPVLEMLARKADPQSEAAADLHTRLALIARQTGDVEKALRRFEAALALAPASRPVREGLAELRFEREEWGEAAKFFRSLLADAPADGDVHDLHLKLAACEAALGDGDAALASYGKAAAGGALSRGAREEIAALHAAAGDFAALVLDKGALLALPGTDDDARARLAEEIGDLHREKLEDPAQAIAAYQTVLAAQPNRRSALEKLLGLHTAGKQWAPAVDAMVRLAELEPEPSARAERVHAAAMIRRDELADAEGAVELFNWALDEDPERAPAFEAIERMLTEAESWKELARNYTKMIKRLPSEGAIEPRLRLWNSLGEVSLLKLDDAEMATTAFEAASSLDPDNIKRHEALAELYVDGGPDKLDKAIAQHQLLLSRNPDRLASYRALAKLYREVGATDKLWCVAATLTFLRKADADLQQVYERWKPREPRPARRPFTDELWEKVVHPQEDPFVAAVFMLLGHFVAATAAQQHQAVGLRRKDRVDVANDARLPMRVLRYVSQTLELPAPDVFYRDADAQGLSMLNLQEKGILTPAFVVGPGIAQRTSEPEIVFEIGKGMAFLRPERFLRYAVASPAGLDVALRSALALGGAGIGPGEHDGEVDKLTDQLRRMVPKPVAEQLAIVGRKLVSEHGGAVNMNDWLAATDLTAARVGFVLSNDLPAAARVISGESPSQSALGAKQRLKDLLTYSVSEDYFAVRKFLGFEVAPPTGATS